MHKLGIGHNDSVGIIGENRPEWVYGEVSAHALRAMIFGIYQDSLNEEWGMTVIMIEHDMGVVMDISHRVMVLDFGKEICTGLPDEVMDNEQVKSAYLGVGLDDETQEKPGEVA